MKNIVFMLDIDIQGEGRYSSTRRLPYKYSIESWKLGAIKIIVNCLC